MESSYQTISKMPMSAFTNMISNPAQKSAPYQIQAASNSTANSSSNNSKHPNGLSINLSQKGLTAEQLNHLASNFPLQSAISTLKLGFNDLRDEGAVVISSLLQKNRSITLLDLGFTNIADSGIEVISSALIYNQTLKVLYLSGNLVTASGFKSLGNALSLNKTLQALYLTGNTGKADGAKHIAKGLKFNNSLQKLFLNGNKIEYDGCSSISDTLLTNHSLISLNLSDNNIGDSGLLSLSEAMANHRNLQELELSFNKITSIGMSPFIDSLIGYHALRRLLLDNNKLEDAGAKSLALALPHMRLSELNIGFNEISVEGLLSIIGSITNSKSLTSIVLSGNTIDDTVAKALANMFMINNTLHAVYVDRTNLTSVGERFIATGIASNRHCALKTLTGFELGKVLHLLGSPSIVCDMSNELALKYLSQMWKNVEKSQKHHYQNQHHHHNHHHHQQQQNQTSQQAQISTSDSRKSLGSKSSESASSNNNEAAPEEVQDTAMLVINARKLKESQFSNSDFWALHQYFYSPPPRPANENQNDSNNEISSEPEAETTEGNSNQNTHERPVCESNSRPMKKQGNKYTVPRINEYVNIKALLEKLKIGSNESKSLIVMRQLKYLEESLHLDPSALESFFFEKVFEM